MLRALAIATMIVPQLSLAETADGETTGLELVMFEQAGCIYCAQWNAEVGDAYAKTNEGRAAPLRRVDIHGPMPADLDIATMPIFTPTFVLVLDGEEITRLEGYPGEDFFWPILDQMLEQAAQRQSDGA